jgi:hypothetical protein
MEIDVRCGGTRIAPNYRTECGEEAFEGCPNKATHFLAPNPGVPTIDNPPWIARCLEHFPQFSTIYFEVSFEEFMIYQIMTS